MGCLYSRKSLKLSNVILIIFSMSITFASCVCEIFCVCVWVCMSTCTQYIQKGFWSLYARNSALAAVYISMYFRSMRLTKFLLKFVRYSYKKKTLFTSPNLLQHRSCTYMSMLSITGFYFCIYRVCGFVIRYLR